MSYEGYGADHVRTHATRPLAFSPFLILMPGQGGQEG